MQRWRVPLGFACAALFFLLAQARPLTLIVGGLVALPGLALRAWATGHLRKNDALATTGPYAYTRNPLYLGSFVIGLGFTIAAGRLILGLVFAVLFLGIYVPVMRVEAKTLAELFGKDYQDYAAAVPLFLPRATAYRVDRAATIFDPALYRRYREHRAAIGLVVAWLLLAIKGYYLR
ncbi:MAG TPA: isoprenylcysteine carboxylmethyltransferase family protein [Pyrinomonadaceae bacterium]|nr:isoprenylcysteine carboxylmethyltransferase family protein [Pyrinomonadaceae bacterium]